MKLFRSFLYIPVVALLVLTACAKQETESFETAENIALKAWMQKNHKDLVENYQSAGGYYVEVHDKGNMKASPINTEACWVTFDFSGRDLAGNIVLTRRADEAHLANTFTKYTHYVPYYRYCGDQNTNLIEGTYLAMRNKLTLGEKYSTDHGLDREFLLREGSKVTLYMPSRVVGSGVSGSGGYEGQYTLDAQRPFIVTIEIRDTVKNPLKLEGEAVDAFCKTNGGLEIFDKKNNKMPTSLTDPKHPYNNTNRWVSACDSIAQLYINYRFDPKGDRYTYTNPYDVGLVPYNKSDGLVSLENEISEALVKRFHKDVAYKGVVNLKADSIKLAGTAKIWYIGRFLDGFIFDTNIDEVKKIIYGKVASKGEALSYTPNSGGLINAFYYTVPHLQYGQWASIITTSTYGYGSSGKSGSSSTSSSGGGYSSNYSDYLNYSNYMNSYYGSNGYYGGYYNNYYGGYNGGYYGNYYNNYDSSSSTTTTTTVSTEIQPYMPLIFEFYIEPKK